jgi:hypothetical protein
MERDDVKVHEVRFMSLVLSLYNSAWIALGKVANPISGKVEVDLEAARGSIDLLQTLEVKTKGNVTREEEKMIAGCLTTLRLNYVAENTAAGKTPAREAPQPEETGKDTGADGKETSGGVAGAPGKT